MNTHLREADDAADMVAVAVREHDGDRLVGEFGDGLREMGHPGARIDQQGPVVAFEQIDRLVI